MTELQIHAQLLGHVALAMGLGAAIGLERELADKPAGMRTHMLLAGAAAFLVTLGSTIVSRYETGPVSGIVQSDPIRIIEAVITGVSFLGAGTIIRRSGEHPVEGLTTAASLMLSAALGVCVALGQFYLAIGVTLLALLTLRVLLRFEGWLQSRR